MSIQAASGAAQTAILMNSAKAKMDAVPGGGGDVETGQQQGTTSVENEGMCGARSLRTRIVQAIAILAVVLWGIAIGIELSIITYVAGACTAVLAPVVIVLQMRLQDTDSMRFLQNALRQDVNRFQVENNKLSAEVIELEQQVGLLREQEHRLEDITKQQGTNVEEFVGLVKENRALIEKQKAVVRNDTAQLLSSVVINSDGNCDGTLDELELRKLSAKLRALPGIRINEKKFMESVLTSGGNVGSILELVNKVTIQETDGDDDDNVFTVVKEEESDDDDDEKSNRKDKKKKEDKK